MRITTKSSHPFVGVTQKRVVILGLPPVDSLDVIGPAEVFAYANNLHRGDSAPYVLELVCAGANEHLESSTGIALMAHKTLEQERLENKAIDTLIVTSGWKAMDQLDQSAIEWIRTEPRASGVCARSVSARSPWPRQGYWMVVRQRPTGGWRVAWLIAIPMCR